MSDPMPTGASPPETPGIDQRISRIDQQIIELGRIQARSRGASLIVLLIVAAEFAAFAFMTRSHVEANFNDQDVQKALADRLPDVTPELRDHFVRVMQHVLPVYRQQAMARFQVAGPAVAKDAMARLEKLPEENGQEMQQRLDGAFANAMDRLSPDITATYPTLSNDRKLQIMHSEFQTLIDEQNEGIARKVTTIYVAEQESTRSILDKFDIPGDVGKLSPSAREREFLHALVDVLMDSNFNLDLSTIGPPPSAPATSDVDVTGLAKPVADK